MRRRGPRRSGFQATWPILALLLGLLPAEASQAVGAGEPPARDDCRRIELTDATSGKPLAGIEDIVVDEQERAAYLSAQDRWSLEAAAEAGAESLPQGGVYRLGASQVAEALSGDGAGALRLENLAATPDGELDFHPHGIALLHDDKGPPLLAAINRQYRREPEAGNDWRRTDRIEIFTVGPQGLRHRGSLEDPLLCRPNDLAWLDPGHLLVTNDHVRCSRTGRWLESLFGGDGTLVLARVTEDFDLDAVRLLADGLPYANGIAIDRAAGRVLVAATRDSAIYDFALEGLEGAPGDREKPTRIAVDGGPDNLTWADGGPLLAALHPSLLRLGLYRNRLFGVEQAASRVVALCGADRQPKVLFEDPDGALFPAATVAALLDGHLLIGSVTGPGLLACRYVGGRLCGSGS